MRYIISLMTAAVIIPARYESSRFPGKPLALIDGKPMIEWVVNVGLGSKVAKKVIVATDDERIKTAVEEKFADNEKVKVVMTSPEHKCGTDRITEVVEKDETIEYIVNLQGDEPLLPSSYIDGALDPVLGKVAEMATLATDINPFIYTDTINNPNIVKVITDNEGFAINFSRKKMEPSDCDPVRGDKNIAIGFTVHYRHIGLYVYTRESLLKFNSLEQSEKEKEESLEQLRALDNGIKIKVYKCESHYPSVDVPDDIKSVEDALKDQREAKA